MGQRKSFFEVNWSENPTRNYKINANAENQFELRARFKHDLLPKNLNRTYAIKNRSTNVLEKKSVIDILIDYNILESDCPYFEKADVLLKKGATLPNPYFQRQDFLTTKDYFQYLIASLHDLYIVLHATPKIINAKDENGMTLLHHALQLGAARTRAQATLLQFLLLRTPGIDMNVRDNEGNTALHSALICAGEAKTIFPYFLENFIQKLTEKEFDFSATNNNKQNIFDVIEAQLVKFDQALTKGLAKHTACFKEYYAKRNVELKEIKTQLNALQPQIYNEFRIN